MQSSAIVAGFVCHPVTRPEMLPRKPLPKPRPKPEARPEAKKSYVSRTGHRVPLVTLDSGSCTLPESPSARRVDEVVFRLRRITNVYDMGEVQVHALRGVDLELYAGELVVLLGPSGSGKSTLLNILGGLDRATSGQVTYRGFDLTNASDRELTGYRRYQVGFVFQFYSLIPSLTARENVSIVTEISHFTAPSACCGLQPAEIVPVCAPAPCCWSVFVYRPQGPADRAF